MKKQIREIIISSVNQLNNGLGEKVVLIREGKDSPLYGAGSLLDSMGLISLTGTIEDEVKERFSKTISLLGETEKSDSNNPFESVESLESYILKLLK